MRRSRAHKQLPPGVLRVITGRQAQKMATDRGIQFTQYTGSVRVTGSFYIRAGSVSIFRGTDLAQQWEDAIPGIRYVEVSGLESVICVSADVMLIASPYPIVPQSTIVGGTVVPVQVNTLLGTGGFLALEVWRNGVRSPEDPPWFFFTGSLSTDPSGFINAATTVQVDPVQTRVTCTPPAGIQFQSSNTTANLGDPAFLLQGVNLFGAADSRALPFYHRFCLPINSSITDSVAIVYWEMASVTANFTFSTTGTPGAAVRGFYNIIPKWRNDQPDYINSQIFCPGWVPAAGNKVMGYACHLTPQTLAGVTTTHGSGLSYGLFNAPTPRATTVVIGLRSYASGR